MNYYRILPGTFEPIEQVNTALTRVESETLLSFVAFDPLNLPFDIIT
jgi:hypothetical protein